MRFTLSFLPWSRALLAILIAFSFTACKQEPKQATQVKSTQTQDKSASPSHSPKLKKPVKNVVLFIGDGMGVQQLSLAVMHRQLRRGGDNPLAMEKLWNSDGSGLMRTNSFGDIVTDSGAAATTLACGIKTRNQMIGLNPDGYPCETILEKAAKMGKGTGLVTTSRLTHATPAAFAAHQVSRKLENEIGEDIIEKHDIDVMLSGGARHLIPQYKDAVQKTPMLFSDLPECFQLDPRVDGKSKRKDQKNLIEIAKQKGYRFVCNRTQLEAAAQDHQGKLLGLFARTVFPMVQERRAIDSLPSLAQMTEVALDRLSKNEEGFFLMVEGALIDYAGHDNDAGTMLHETIDFDQSVQVAMNFAKKHPDTLILITADHETGGFGFAYGSMNSHEEVIPSGLQYKNPYDFAPVDRFSYLETQKMSFAAMVDPIINRLYSGSNSGYDIGQASKDLVRVVQENSMFKLSEEQAKEVLMRKPGKDDAEPHDFTEFYVHDPVHRNMLGRALATQSNTVWAAGTHTSTPVPVLASGPVQYVERVQGFIDNTEIPKIIEDAFLGK